MDIPWRAAAHFPYLTCLALTALPRFLIPMHDEGGEWANKMFINQIPEMV